MRTVVLTLRETSDVPIEAPSVRPDAFGALSEEEIARLPAWHGNEELALGDVFDVRGGRSDDVRVCGNCMRIKHLGEGMEAGRLTIEGDAGMHAGAEMRGGRLVVEGSAGDYAGAAMTGGTLVVRGDAGERAGGAYPGGRGMAGGMLLVHGSAGAFAGERMRRGVLGVAGAAGDAAGAFMLAGTIVVCGDLGARPGFGLSRGSIVALGAVEPLPTFRYAYTGTPSFVPLLLRELVRAGLSVPERAFGGAFRQYGGDYAELGRGEVLAWTAQ